MSGMEAFRATSIAGRPARSWFGWRSLTALAAVAIATVTSPGSQVARAQAPIKTPQTKAPTLRPLAPQASRGGTGSESAPKRSAEPAPAAAKGAAAGTGPSAPPPVASLKVMAVVNGEPISREELGGQCLRRYGEEVLESLVNMQLLQEACQARGIQITEKDVNAEIDRIAAKFGLPRDRWLGLLREERGYNELQYRREVVWPMLALRRLAADDVQVTDQEIQKGFETEYGPKVRARMIILPTLQKAQAVQAEAAADPRKFGQLAKQHCEDPSIAAASGVIPPISRHLGNPEIEQAAFRMKKGDVSQPIKVADKYVILYCEDLVPQQYVSTQNLPMVEQQLRERLKEEKIRSASARFFADIQKSAQIVNIWTEPAKRNTQPGVAATVNGKPITVERLTSECLERYGADVLEGEINRKILTQELSRRKIGISDQDLHAEIARAAESYGVFKKGTTTPDVDAWLAQVTSHDGATVDVYTDDAVWPSVALKKLVGGKVQVTDDDLQKGFESSYGERVEVLAVVVGDQRQSQRVWEMARDNPTDAYFEELAEKYSIEPASRSNRGKVPPIRRHSGSGVIEQEAFKLKPGELSGILAIDDQFIILRCLGRTKPVQVDFASVRDNLYKDIHEKKIRVEMNKEFDRLLTSAQIDNFVSGKTQAGRRTSAAAPSANASSPTDPGAPGKLAPIRSGNGAGATVPSTATAPKGKTVR